MKIVMLIVIEVVISGIITKTIIIMMIIIIIVGYRTFPPRAPTNPLSCKPDLYRS